MRREKRIFPVDVSGVVIPFASITRIKMEKTVLMVANNRDRRSAVYTPKQCLGVRSRLSVQRTVRVMYVDAYIHKNESSAFEKKEFFSRRMRVRHVLL